MIEYSVPATIQVPDDANLTDAVFDNAAEHPDVVVFERKVDGQWQHVTAKDFAEQVKAVAAGLIAAGVQAGDRVALMSATRYEWTLLDYAIWSAGAITVPIYETSSPDQLAWIVSDSGAVGVVLEAASHRASYDQVAKRLPNVQHVWSINEGAVDHLVQGSRSVGEDEITARRATLTPDSLATIIYTSGTTGEPKGCELTHRNFLFDGMTATNVMDELFTDGSTLLFLPLAHAFARIIQVGCMLRRVRTTHTADVKNLLADLAEFQPTFILSVPRVFEKVYNGAKQKAHAGSPVKGRIFDAAERVAIAYSHAQDGPLVQRLALEAPHRLFDALVYSKLRQALGGQVGWAVSGGAPLGARLGHFFRGIGLTVLEGYGLTETTAASTANVPKAVKIGSVGQPLPGTAVRIAEDGEVLLKGDHVFRGYFNNPQATQDVLEPDGWLHTGDVGELDADGFLSLTGRKKELIITAAGKNVAPAVLEDRLRAHPLISQCMVVGDRRPYVGCLITLDVEALPAWKQAHGKPADATIGDLVDDPELRSQLQHAVDDANKAVSKAEAIKAFRVLADDFTEERGHLTPTFKLKRSIVLKDYAPEVEALYAGANATA